MQILALFFTMGPCEKVSYDELLLHTSSVPTGFAWAVRTAALRTWVKYSVHTETSGCGCQEAVSFLNIKKTFDHKVKPNLRGQCS